MMLDFFFRFTCKGKKTEKKLAKKKNKIECDEIFRWCSSLADIIPRM